MSQDESKTPASALSKEGTYDPDVAAMTQAPACVLSRILLPAVLP